MEQNSFRIRLLRAVSEAMRPAWRTAVWVIKMVVPITLAISILEHLGVIGRISEWIARCSDWSDCPATADSYS